MAGRRCGEDEGSSPRPGAAAGRGGPRHGGHKKVILSLQGKGWAGVPEDGSSRQNDLENLEEPPEERRRRHDSARWRGREMAAGEQLQGKG